MIPGLLLFRLISLVFIPPMTNLLEVDPTPQWVGSFNIDEEMTHRIFIRCRIQTATTTVEVGIEVP